MHIWLTTTTISELFLPYTKFTTGGKIEFYSVYKERLKNITYITKNKEYQENNNTNNHWLLPES